MDRDEVLYAFRRSGLRGRGGAGFPMGRKAELHPEGVGAAGLRGLQRRRERARHLQGPRDDRDQPLPALEGVTIAGYAIGAVRGYIYIRGEYEHQARVLDSALAQARAAGLLGMRVMDHDFDFDITLYRGAGAYICGEETALLESLEGKRGQPRLKPPFPALAGLYGAPTLINNVETLAALPPIIENGPDWYAAMGTEKSTGTKVFSISGHVERPGNYEIVMRDDHAARAGLRPGGRLPPGARLQGRVGRRLERERGRRRGARHPARLRVARRRRHLAGLGRLHRDGRLRQHRALHAAPGDLLPARVVREVHALPRGDALAGADPSADR